MPRTFFRVTFWRSVFWGAGRLRFGSVSFSCAPAHSAGGASTRHVHRHFVWETTEETGSAPRFPEAFDAPGRSRSFLLPTVLPITLQNVKLFMKSDTWSHMMGRNEEHSYRGVVWLGWGSSGHAATGQATGPQVPTGPSPSRSSVITISCLLGSLANLHIFRWGVG